MLKIMFRLWCRRSLPTLTTHFRKHLLNKSSWTVTTPFPTSQKGAPRFWVSYMGILTYLGLAKDSEKEESMRDKTVKTVKMAILAKQEGRFNTSEQLFHLALKMAQEQMDYNGVTYINDGMANLALETGDFTKAEILFKDVSQRLINSGTSEDDPAIIEISIKLAGIYSALGRNEEADTGFAYCLHHLEKKVSPEASEDCHLLMAMCADAYGKHLMKLKNYSEAVKYFSEALQIYTSVNGTSTPQSLVLMNNLGSAYCMMGQFSQAIQQLSVAITNAKAIESQDLSAYYRNLGMVYLQMGELGQAEHYCKRANICSKDDEQQKKEAQSCLEAIKQAKI